MFAGRLDCEYYYVVVHVDAVASCVVGEDAEQVVEGLTRFAGRIQRVAAMSAALVVVCIVRQGMGRSSSCRMRILQSIAAREASSARNIRPLHT